MKFLAIASLALVAWAGPTAALATEEIIKPICPANYERTGGTGLCKPTTTYKASLDGDQKSCSTAGGTHSSGSCTVSDKEPSCAGSPRVRYSADADACVYDSAVQPPARSNYVSDCLKQVTQIPDAPTSEYLYVLSQSEDNSSLNVVPAETSWLTLKLYCGVKSLPEGQRHSMSTIKTQDVIDSGALRRGITWGTLVVPFKYYLGQKDLAASTTVAPYIGRRSEFLGGTTSFIVGAGIGLVPGSSLDASGAAQSEQLTSFSYAVGVTFETRKPNGSSGRGFQSGLVIGQDRVSRADRAKFQYQGKTWLSFQIGYDFTDF